MHLKAPLPSGTRPGQYFPAPCAMLSQREGRFGLVEKAHYHLGGDREVKARGQFLWSLNLLVHSLFVPK